jgi:tetratricopeptide (TPR) repeat protein
LKRRLLALAVSLAALPIAYLAVKSAAPGVSARAAALAGALPPRDDGPAVKAAAKVAQLPQVRVSGAMVHLARNALASAPLSFEPFIILARAEEQAGRMDRAIRLMEEARRRRPTYSPARMHLLAYYSRVSRYPAALKELDLLLRRNADVRRLLLPEVTKLLANPQGRAALASMLATGPEWRGEFFDTAAERKVPPEQARTLYALIRAANPKGDLRLERQLVFQSLASAGQFRQARQEWLQGIGQAERGKSALLYDGSFTGAPAPKPFGWQLTDTESGRAEIARDAGRTYLDVAYFNGSDVVLAEQTLALAPGRYTLRVIARSENGLDPGRLAWRLTCLPTRSLLASLDLAGAAAAPKPFAAGFAVPGEGCAGQRLVLVARAGDTAKVTTSQVDRVEVVQ